MDFMKTTHTKWIRSKWIRGTSWLLMVVGLLLTPVASMAAPAQPQKFAPSSYLPLTRNNYCSGTRSSDIPLGTQIYGATGYKTSHFSLLQNTNTPWLRDSIYWISVEPENVPVSQYKWGTVDAVLRAANANCLNMIVTIEGVPTWATTETLPLNTERGEGQRAPIKAANIPDFVQFVTALVERYDGDGINDAPNGIVVNYWEFFNEPDLGSEVAKQTGYGNFGAKYADLLKAVYAPIKAANPNAQVVFGGIAYNLFVGEGNGGLFVRDFFKNVLDAGGGDYFDIMNFHYYPFQHNRVVWTDTNSSGLRDKYASLKAIMDAHNVHKPFMITEVGWHNLTTNSAYPSTDEFQARRVVELLTQGMSIGSELTIWWTFFDERQDFAYRTGLTTADSPPTVKPSYAVYVEALKRLGNSEFKEVTSMPTTQNDLEAYRFLDKNTNKTFYVAWLNPTVYVNADAVSAFNDAATQNLQVPHSNATIYNKDGSVKETINDGSDGVNDGKVTVSVGRSPIYIVIN
jgi:hypothetical protein